MDSNVGNNQADCSLLWNGASSWPISPDFPPAPTALHKNNQTGWIEFDVTLGLSESGWLIKKTDETLGGSVDYTSIQSPAAQRPRLVINWQENAQDHTPPVISAAVSPSPNSAGWNNTDIVVSFTCSDETGLAFCPPPITVTTEGANQIFTGTAVDNGGNSTTAAVTINLDKTSPDLAVLSPANGTIVLVDTLEVTGTLADLYSGISYMTCNSVPIDFVTGTFNCGISLLGGLNSIIITAGDGAENETVTILEVTYSTESATFPSITGVEPFIVSADGSPKTISVSGKLFTSNMLLFLDDELVPFQFISGEQISLTVTFSNSAVHFLEIRQADGEIVSSLERGLIAVKSDEIVLSQVEGPDTGGTVVNVYAVNPFFEEGTQVSFTDLTNMTIPVETTFVSGNELEIVTPASSGIAAITIDNPVNGDIYQADAYTFYSYASWPPSVIEDSQPLTGTCTCKIKAPPYSFSVISGLSGFRRFHAATECCSLQQTGKRYQIVYFVDGKNYSSSCNDLAPLSVSAEWVFPVNQTHTIGAQLVEWWNVRVPDGDGGFHLEKECDAHGPIVSATVKIGGAHSSDSDADSIAKAVEDDFMNIYRPVIFRYCIHEILDFTYCVPISSYTLRVGPVILKQAAPRVDIVMNYNLLYDRDFGCFTIIGFVGGHPFDTEPFGYLLQRKGIYPDAFPDEEQKWEVKQSKTVGHDGTAGQRVQTKNGFWPYVFVGAWKHANYLEACNPWYQEFTNGYLVCDQCSPVDQVNVNPHNVGNTIYYGGNCLQEHGDIHLFTRDPGFKVPEKWGRMVRFFSNKYLSPFADQ